MGLRATGLGLLAAFGLAIASAQGMTYTFVGKDHSGRLEIDLRAEPCIARGMFVRFARGAVLGRLTTITTEVELEVQRVGKRDYSLVTIPSEGIAGYTALYPGLVRPWKLGSLRRVKGGFEGTLYNERVFLKRTRPVPKDVEVVIVRGLGCTPHARLIPSLEENIATLEARGWTALRAPVNSLKSVDQNARTLVRTLRDCVARGKRPLIFAHSKGAVDTIAALYRDTELGRHVYGMIALQPAYNGSPIADLMDESGLFHGVIGFSFEYLMPFLTGEDGGNKQAILDLRGHVRRERAQREDSARILRQIPTVTVRSYFKRGTRPLLEGDSVHDPVSLIFQNYLEDLGRGPSDGLVLLEDQVLPGSRRVLEFSNLSHSESILRGRRTKHTPCEVTHRALDALLAVRREPTFAMKLGASHGRTEVDLPLGR